MNFHSYHNLDEHTAHHSKPKFNSYTDPFSYVGHTSSLDFPPSKYDVFFHRTEVSFQEVKDTSVFVSHIDFSSTGSAAEVFFNSAAPVYNTAPPSPKKSPTCPKSPTTPAYKSTSFIPTSPAYQPALPVVDDPSEVSHLHFNTVGNAYDQFFGHVGKRMRTPYILSTTRMLFLDNKVVEEFSVCMFSSLDLDHFSLYENTSSAPACFCVDGYRLDCRYVTYVGSSTEEGNFLQVFIEVEGIPLKALFSDLSLEEYELLDYTMRKLRKGDFM